jgi:dimethylargininase
MQLVAITREVSPSINRCELSFHNRDPIDLAKAIAQHQVYRDCLTQLGVTIISLPAESELPDAVFVEDAAVVVDEVAIITIMGAPSRRAEAESLIDPLSRYRPVKFLAEPATLDGGDVLRTGDSIFVGLSQRTNREGFTQLQNILQPHPYRVEPVEVTGCLHLKSACSYIGKETLLINRSLINAEPFREFHLIDVPGEESAGANALLVNGVVVIPACFPKTRNLLERQGFHVRMIDVSELQKAEAGVTCCSLLFRDETGASRTGIEEGQR